MLSSHLLMACKQSFPVIFTLNWASYCCDGHSQRQSSPFISPPSIVAPLLVARGSLLRCREERASSDSVNLSPKWKPNLTPSAAALNTPDLKQRCKTDGSPVKAGSRERQRQLKYRQIAREDHTHILGNSTEPVNFGSQALFRGLKIKISQKFFSAWKLTWHIYPGLMCYRWSPKSWILLFFILQVTQRCLAGENAEMAAIFEVYSSWCSEEESLLGKVVLF